jgi:hypothetical protein
MNQTDLTLTIDGVPIEVSDVRFRESDEFRESYAVELSFRPAEPTVISLEMPVPAETVRAIFASLAEAIPNGNSIDLSHACDIAAHYGRRVTEAWVDAWANELRVRTEAVN